MTMKSRALWSWVGMVAVLGAALGSGRCPAAPVTIAWSPSSQSAASATVSGDLRVLFPTDPSFGTLTQTINSTSPGSEWFLQLTFTDNAAGVISLVTVLAQALNGGSALVVGPYTDLVNGNPTPLVRSAQATHGPLLIDSMQTSLADLNGASAGVTVGPAATMSLAINVQQVPEPSVLVLSGLGLAGIALSRRVRRQI